MPSEKSLPDEFEADTICPEPGGCSSCPDPDYCRTLRIDAGVTTEAQEKAKRERSKTC